MKNTVINLFLEKQLNLKQISEVLGISKEIADKYLKEEYYILHIQRSFERTVKIKQAIDEYLQNDKKIGATTIAKKYGLPHTTLIDCMHQIGIEVPNNQNRTKFNQHVFDIIDTEEKAYWLGFMYADGYIDSTPLDPNKKSRYQIELSLSDKDSDHLYKFNKFMEHESDNVKISKVRCNGKMCGRCRWSIVNKHLWTSLNNLGCIPQKSLILRFPEEEIFKSKDLIRHFIRGYFDGDGSLGVYPTKYKTPHFSCSVLGTEHFLNGIMNYIDIEYKLEQKESHSEETYCFQLTSHRSRKFLDYIYLNCNICLNRKYEKYLEFCRLYEESYKLLGTNIGGGCDANPEVTTEIKESVAP